MGVKIRQLKGRAGWYIDVHVDGKRTTRAVGKSRKVAERIAAELELAHAKGKVGLIDDDVTFADCARKWLETIELRRAPGTLKRYTVLMAVAVKAWGKRPVASVSRGDVRDLLLRHYKGGAAKASVGTLHAVLSGIFHHAIDDGLIATSPATRAMSRLGLAEDQPEISPLTADEMAAAIAAIQAPYRAVLVFLYQTGCRVGEALPLLWTDVDLARRAVSINKTAKDQIVRPTTKTGGGRVVAVSDELHAMLAKMQGEGLVFPAAKGGMISDNALRRQWSLACQSIGIGHKRLHDIRHTVASILLARGAPVTMVASLLGHASTKMTLDRYGHYIPTESQGHINLLNS